jgi:benzoyl-CoA reductase/2-hydroxyglutaryl-CoA dehydratase subunit BcrC/BadD/HgdB
MVVVAGGDCQNALVDAEKLELNLKIPSHYFFYQFGDKKHFFRENNKLIEFLGGNYDEKIINEIHNIKEKVKKIDKLCCNDGINCRDAFYICVSASDLEGNPKKYEDKVDSTLETSENVIYDNRIAILGVPPIFSDFYDFLIDSKLHCVYNELPYEFVRMGGKNLKEVVNSYSEYTFSNHILHRLKTVKKQLKKRNVDGIIHYTQINCHHKLEDEILREYLDYPILTIEGDLPQKTPEQTKLRIEAFNELLR